MRSAALLLAILLMGLSACTGGQDPWSTDGWVNNQMDYETDFWEEIEKPEPVRRAPTPPRPTTVPYRVQPQSRPMPPGGSVVPPPPPPPYALPR